MEKVLKTKFGVMLEKGNMAIRELDITELKSDEVLVKQMSCNICTADYQQWMGDREHQGYPMAGGHECSGIIVEKGKDVGGSLDIGDHVAVVYDYCGVCDNCKQGEISFCENKKIHGKNFSDEHFGMFGFAEHFVRKAKSVVKVSKNLPFHEAAFVEPLASVIANMRKIEINSGLDNVVVIGGGTMGLLNAQVARAFGAKATISENQLKKREIASSMDIETISAKEVDPVEEVMNMTRGKGVDVVIIVATNQKSVDQGIKMLKKFGGKLSLFGAGFPSPSLSIGTNEIHYRNIRIIGSYGSNLEDFMNAAKMLSEKRVDVSNMVQEKIDLINIQDGFKKASERGAMRISIDLS